jgi:hypothetical protein
VTPGKATLAIKVGEDRRPVSIAVMASSKIIAEVSIKDVLAIVAQLEQLERIHGSAEQENSED